jgi:hypothetical protein
MPDAALAYINYPLLLLSKSCKLVPVMLMGRVLRGVRYRWEAELHLSRQSTPS